MSLLQICLIAGVATATLGIGAAVTINKIQAKTVAAEQVRKDSADVYARRQTIYASCVSEKLRRAQVQEQRKEDEYVNAMHGKSYNELERLERMWPGKTWQQAAYERQQVYSSITTYCKGIALSQE